MKWNQLRHLETQNLDLNENFSLIYLRAWKFGATYHIFFTATGTNPHLYPISNLPRENCRNVRKPSPWLNFAAEAKPSGVFTLWSQLCVTEGQILCSDWYHWGWISEQPELQSDPQKEQGGFQSWQGAPACSAPLHLLSCASLKHCCSHRGTRAALKQGTHSLLAKTHHSLSQQKK